MRKTIAALLTMALSSLFAFPAAADWPDRPIKLVVPFTPGGSSDTLARIIADALRDKLGQSVIVENRAGGNGTIGVLAVASGPPDGYTVLSTHMGTHAIGPAITPPSGYDIAKTFVTIAVPATSASVLVVRSDRGIANLKELIDTARSKPAALNYGTPGTGSPAHMAVVQLESLSKSRMTHVPYRGGSAVVTDLLGGTLDFTFLSPAEVLEHVRAGKFRALATSGAQRSSATPEIPSAAEVLPGYDFRMWHVMAMRADTPPAILARMQQALTEILASPSFQKRLDELSLDRGMPNAAEAEKFVQAEIARWTRIVKEAGIKAQ
jgi:tripartite-type tricarboxylate transporter receptor subunit TctC